MTTDIKAKMDALQESANLIFTIRDGISNIQNEIERIDEVIAECKSKGQDIPELDHTVENYQRSRSTLIWCLKQFGVRYKA